MASTYTTNLGIEKIGTGEQSGTWGDTTNTNFDILDEAINGIISITLSSAGSSGSPTALPITDGSSSNGRNKFIEFTDGGDLGGTAYVQLTPNDAEKIVHIRNSLSGSRSVIVFQGTYNASNDFEIANGADVLLKFNGGGSGATVTDVNVDLTVTGVTATTANATTVDTTNIEVTNIKAKDGTAAGSIADSTGVVTLASSVLTTADINGGTADGVTIGGSTAAAGTFTTFTSNGIDDNADATAITIDSSENVGIGGAPSSNSGYTTLTLNGNTNGAVLEFENSGTRDALIYQNGSNDLVVQSESTKSLAFNTSGSNERMRIDSSGNVIVGATSAGNAKVTSVNGVAFEARDGTQPYYQWYNSGAGTDLKYWRCGNNTGGDLQWQTVNDAYNSAAVKMTITNSGNVGIGTTSPDSLLHVGTGTNTDGTNVTFTIGGDSANNRQSLILKKIQSGDRALQIHAAAGGSDEDIRFFSDSSTERMRIDSSGNVGIGTSSPSRTLDIVDTSDNPIISLVSSTSDTPKLLFGDTDSDIRGRIEYENANDKMRFYAAGTNRLSIQSNGQILASSCVFTSAVQDYTETGLYLSNEGSSIMQVGAWRSGSSVAVLTFATDSGSDAAPVERARITGGGDFLVNRTGSPTTSNTFDMGFTPSTGTLYINSASTTGPLRLNQTTGDTAERLQIRFFRSESVVGSISSTTSATAYNTSSDVRLKENIVDAPAGNIDGIRVRSFDWKSDGTHQPYGMIAQELVSVAPEVIHQGETDDDMWEVDYSKLVPMMIKEIQDLKAEVAALKGA